jgi:hypothetical protein
MPGGGDNVSLGIGDEAGERHLDKPGKGDKGRSEDCLRGDPMFINKVIQLRFNTGNPD